MYINDYVKLRTINADKKGFIETNIINPLPEQIVKFLIDKIDSRFTPKDPLKWKEAWIDDVNRAEEKSYDRNMSMEQCVEVLRKEGVIRFDETSVPFQETKQNLQTGGGFIDGKEIIINHIPDKETKNTISF